MGAALGYNTCCGTISTDVIGEQEVGSPTVDERKEKITIVETEPTIDVENKQQEGASFTTIAHPVLTAVASSPDSPDSPEEKPAPTVGSTNSITEAIKRGKRSSVLRHVEEGADLDAVDEQGVGVLHLAMEGQGDIAADLVMLGANINAMDKVGKTPMHYAAIYGNAAQVAVMLERNANVDACDNTENTALHYAAEMSQMDVAKVLLMSSADVNRKNDVGYTPMGMAEDMGTLPMQELLKLHGGDRGDGRSARGGVRADRLYSTASQATTNMA